MNQMYQIQNKIMNHKSQMTPTATTMITMLFAQKLTQLENVNSETDTFGINVEYARNTPVLQQNYN